MAAQRVVISFDLIIIFVIQSIISFNLVFPTEKQQAEDEIFAKQLNILEMTKQTLSDLRFVAIFIHSISEDDAENNI